MAGQLWMFILGVLCCFYSPGCEMSYEWLVQPQPPGIVPAGHGCGAVAAADSLHRAAVRLGFAHGEFRPCS